MGFTPALSTEIPVAWGDMDAFGHVNNTVYLRWFETARIEWLDQVEFPEDGVLGPILARTEIDYRRPVKWRDTVTVSVGVIRVGRTSVTLGYRVMSASFGGEVVAEGMTVVVLHDARTGKGAMIDEGLRGRMGVGAG
jgi:acyl-CoA thioester hydrolase